jgi:hypothetical protein
MVFGRILKVSAPSAFTSALDRTIMVPPPLSAIANSGAATAMEERAMPKHRVPAHGTFSEGLSLLDLLCSRAAAIAERTAEKGEAVNSPAVFAQALADMNCSQSELITLWATLEYASRAASEAANYARLTQPAEQGIFLLGQ